MPSRDVGAAAEGDGAGGVHPGSRRAFLRVTGLAAAGMAAAGVAGVAGGAAAAQLIDPGDAGVAMPSDPALTKVEALAVVLSDIAGVSIKSFGAVGDGVADDTQALTDALASGLPLIVPAGNFRTSATIRRSFSGVHMLGRPGARIFSDTASALFQMLQTDGAHFEGITFEVATPDPTQSSSLGVFYSLNVSIKNVLWTRCKFRTALRAINGVKIVADNVPNAFDVENVFVRSCEFVECARMGFEMQDHTPDPSMFRVRNVGAIDCFFDRCGTLAHGIDLSFSGAIVGAMAVGNRFRSSITIALEVAGGHVGPVLADNVFEELGAKAHTISVTGPKVIAGCVIERNRTLGRTGFGARFWNLADARLSNNALQVNGYIHVRDCVRSVASGETYDSAGAYALFVESSDKARECADNVWSNSRFSTLASSAPFAVLRFSGAKAHRNSVREARFGYSKGARMDQRNGAGLNEMRNCSTQLEPWAPIRSISMADADRVIGLEEADCDAFVFTGRLTGGRSVTFPRSNRAWQMRNGTEHTLTVNAGGAGIPIPAGASRFVSVNAQDMEYI